MTCTHSESIEDQILGNVWLRAMPERFVVKKNAPAKRPRSVYPFEDMIDVGDYFDAPDDMGSVLAQEGKSARRHSILSSARNYARRHGNDFKVTTTIWYDRKVPFVRCQRVAPAASGELLESAYSVRKTGRKS